MNPLELGELLLAVDAERFPLVVGLRGDDFEAGFDRHFDRVGQIELALRVVVFERREPAGKARGRRDDDAGVDFGDLQLLGTRVLLLDDALHVAVLIAHDAAVTGRDVERDGEHAVAVLAGTPGQCAQRLRTRERHVAIKHQRGQRWIEQRQRLLHRVAGAELLLLHRELDIGRRDGFAHGFGAVADHDDQAGGLQRAGGVDDMSEERPAGQRMEHLGKRGPHALAGTCRQNDDVHGVGK
ncbi:hypothetical protein OKW39_002631 [Paraburkholderia sp. MM6662-R1]